ncbi:MAG: hypothetical protein CVT80_10950 [Alphaproteobacteria bacterium HGW-Alphaproteobacteria-2]|nr:MAG: hypothetical protein CVT80_10950 [Alphaproteobacteria bacterium HGW-Alphaproteobacteria-2]
MKRTGVELAGGLRLSDRLTLSGSYTFTDDSAPASVLAPNAANSFTVLTARHSFAAQLDAKITEKLSAAVTISHKADRPALGAYTLAGASLAYSVSDRAQLYLRVENLFDEDFQQVQGFGTTDRAIYAGIRASL